MSLAKYTVSTSPINGARATAEVELFVFTGYPGLETTVCFSGKAKKLAGGLDANEGDCVASNGCGVHVHEGNSCADSTTQGGHWWKVSGPNALVSDPWQFIDFGSTSGNGVAKFGHCVDVGFDLTKSALKGKPFIVHNNNGGRVSCGIIEKVKDEAPSSSKKKKNTKARRR